MSFPPPSSSLLSSSSLSFRRSPPSALPHPAPAEPAHVFSCEDFPCPPSKNCVCTRVSEQFFCETVSFAEKLIESGEYTRSDLYWGTGSLVYKKGEEHKIRGLKKPVHPAAAAAAAVPDAELVKSSWNQCPSTCGMWRSRDIAHCPKDKVPSIVRFA